MPEMVPLVVVVDGIFCMVVVIITATVMGMMICILTTLDLG